MSRLNRYRRSAYWMASLLLSLLLILHILPLVARDLVVYQLLQQGAEEAELKQIRVHWLDAAVGIEGLRVVSAETPVLSLENLRVDLELSPLFEQRIDIKELEVNGLDIEAQITDTGQFALGNLNFGGEQNIEGQDQDQGETSAWQIGLTNTELRSVALSLMSGETELSVELDSLAMGAIQQWNPAQATSVQLAGRLNDSPIRIDSSATPLPDQKNASGALQIERLELSSLGGFVPFPISGSVAADLNLSVEFSEQGIILGQSGELSIETLQTEPENLTLSADRLGWAGTTEQYLILPAGSDSGLVLDRVRSDAKIELTSLDLVQTLTAAETNEAVTRSLKIPNLNVSLSRDTKLSSVLDLSADTVDLDLGKQQLDLSELTLALDVDLQNPLAPEGLSAALNAGPTAFSDPNASVSLSDLSLQLQTRLPPLIQGEEATFELETQVQQLSVSAAGNQAQLGQIAWAGPITYAPGNEDRSSKLRLTGSLLLEQLSAFAESTELAVERGQVQPALSLDLDQGDITGELRFALVTPDLTHTLTDQPTLRANAAQLGAQLQLSHGTTGSSISGPLFADTLVSTFGETRVSLDELRAPLDFSINAEQISFSTPLALSNFNLSDPSAEVSLSSLESNVDFDQTLESGSFSLSADAARLSGLKTELAAGALALEQLAVASLQVDQQPDQSPTASATEVDVSGFAWQSEQPAEVDLKLGGLGLSRLNYAGNQLDLGAMRVEGLNSVIRILESATESTGEEPAQAQADSTSESSPFLFSMERLQVLPGSVQLINDSESAPLDLRVDLSELQVSRIDSQATQPAEFRAKAQINDRADFDLSGSLQYRGENSSGNWVGSLQQFPLPALSALAQTNIGYALRSGTLRLNSEGTLDQGVLNGNNQINIRRLELQRRANAAAENTDKVVTMPLNTAVALLEDDERTIDLEIPISGALSDPQFNYDAVIERVVAKSVKEGAMALLARSLQPYGALISLVTYVAESDQQGRFVQLSPLNFDSGSVELGAEGLDYASKLSDMMNERPGITIEICPAVLEQERTIIWERFLAENGEREEPLELEALEEQFSARLVQFGDRRGLAVRDALIGLGVADERIFSCLTEIDVAEGDPRVELAF